MSQQTQIGQEAPTSFKWLPLSLGDLLAPARLRSRTTWGLLTLWIGIISFCIYSVTYYAPRFQHITATQDFELILTFATFFPPLILSTLLLFWLGFEWGFIPAYLSTFLIGLASGMQVEWALLFGIAVVLGLGIYALTYYSFQIDYNLRSLLSLSVFVGVSFIASMASSLGGLLWCHVHGINLGQTFTVWKAWWTGSFLQTLIIIGPAIFLGSPFVERWKLRNFSLQPRRSLSLRWVYTAIISVVTVLCLFIWANKWLGSMRIQQTLNTYENVTYESIISVTQAFELTTWIAVSMAVVAGLGGIKLVGTWNKSLRDKVNKRTRQLHERAQQFKATFEQAAVGVAHKSIDGQFLKVNERMEEITGYTAEELKEMNYRDITHTEDIEEEQRQLKNLQRGISENYFREKRYTNSSEDPTWVNVSTSLVRDNDNNPWYFISVVEDITDRKQYEQQIRKSLREKETLLAEIHHRVKNNLAVVSALLEFQAQSTADQATRDLLQHSISRIQSMAMVHRLLYESDSMDNVDLKEYIHKLTETLKNSFTPPEKDISLHSEMEPVELDIQQAIPCGLIINELVINAFKHAFEESERGNIYVRIRPENDAILLQVRDDGKGLPEDLDPANLKSLGMQLIRTLSKQLNAEMTTENRQGAVFNIRFTPE